MMSTTFVITALTRLNLHLCLYGALGIFLLFRAALAIREHKYDQAREDTFIGLIHLLLGLL